MFACHVLLETRTWVSIRYEGDVAPAARAGHSTTLLPDGTLMLFGGYAGDRFFDDFWAFSFGILMTLFCFADVSLVSCMAVLLSCFVIIFICNG